MPESPDFDPYLKWLGIRDSTRPVNHYRLLGLDLYESDPDVISMAADRQMAHIRTYQNGPNGDISQQILSELARARRCLLMAEKKATYDQQLKSVLNPDRVPPTALPLATPINQQPSTQSPVNHRLPPNHSIPVVSATHPPANFQPGDSVQPPPIPVISPTVSSSRNQRPSRKQAVGRQSNFGIRGDGDARKKIRRRERKQLVWTLVSWVSGGVAAVGVAAYLIGAGFVPSPFQAKEDDTPEVVLPDAEGGGFAKSKNGPARSKPKDLTKKNRTNDKANQVVWSESEIKAYPKPDEKTIALVNKIDRAVKRGKTIRFEPSRIEGGDRETVVVPKPARLVIGFAYTTHQDGKIRNVQPVLIDKRLAYVAGKMGDDPRAKYVVAKPGYALGAVKLSSLNPMNCFRITFMKIAEDGLDPNDSYLSRVHGLNIGQLKSVSNKAGLPIVGVYSRSKDKSGIATLGLVGVDFSVARGFDSQPINRDRYKPKSDLRFGSSKNKPDAKPLFPPRKKPTPEVAIGEKRERGKSGFGIAKNAANRPAWFGEAFGIDDADAAPEKKAKLPIPAKRERDRAAKTMKGDYTQAVSAAFASGRVRDVARLGERMINDSQSENMRVVAKYVLLEQARELTMMVGEVETAIKIVREMDRQFDVDFWDVAYSTLHDGARNINKVPRDRIDLQVKFRQTMRGLIDEAIEKRLYNEAGRLATYAVVLAARHNDPNLAATRRFGKDIDELRSISDEAQRLAPKFKKSPGDPTANEAFGKYFFVVEDDLDFALKHWEKAKDKLMVKIAKAEIQIDQAGQADGKKIVALGDLWRLLGKSNKSMFQRKALERAVETYNRASFKLDQTGRADVEDKKAAIKRLLRN